MKLKTNYLALGTALLIGNISCGDSVQPILTGKESMDGREAWYTSNLKTPIDPRITGQQSILYFHKEGALPIAKVYNLDDVINLDDIVKLGDYTTTIFTGQEAERMEEEVKKRCKHYIKNPDEGTCERYFE